MCVREREIGSCLKRRWEMCKNMVATAAPKETLNPPPTPVTSCLLILTKQWLRNGRRNPDCSLVFVPHCAGASHSNSSTSLQTGASVFGGSKDGMHQRSFSVSSADQWNEAINTSTSSGARKARYLFRARSTTFVGLYGTALCLKEERNETDEGI